MRAVLALLFALFVGAAHAQVTPGTTPLSAAKGGSPFVSVLTFGAKCDGTTDDATAIQNAINSLPASGGTVQFPVATCKIRSTLTIGNGSGSAASTKMGVVLQGTGNPATPPYFTGYAATSGPKLLWGGAAGSTMITVLGPLQGWGLQNLYMDCASTAAVGVSVISAQYGDSKNLTITNCTAAALYSTALPTFGFNTDSLHNTWLNTQIVVPAVTGAKGIFLTGVATANTDYNTFINTIISIPSAVSFGVYLQACDTNTFINTQVIGTGNGSVSVVFDYTVNNVWPTSNMFFGIDTNAAAGGAFAQNVGTPNVGGGARPNYFYGVAEGNGGVNPNLDNVSSALPVAVAAPQVNLVAQTASITATNFFPSYKTGLYRINYYMSVTTPGSSGTVNAQFFWVDETGAVQSFTGASVNLSGKNFTQGSFIVDLPPGEVVFTTGVAGAAGSPQYQLRAMAEKLN